MTPRSFLQNQLRDQERAKLAALPTNDALNLLFGQKQPLDASLTALSGKTIGAKGLDLLASSTSAAAINALGGSGGQIVSAMVASLDAAKLTGTIDVARLPVIPGNNSLSATSIASLTTLQQATVSLGTMVYTADGGAWRYSGSGLKTAEASYYYTADVTPEWNAIANKPAFGSAALQDSSAFALAANGITTAERSKLAGLASVASTGAYGDLNGKPTLGTAASQDVSAFATAAQFTTLSSSKFDKAGGTLSGDLFIQKSGNPGLHLLATDASTALVRLKNTAGQYNIELNGTGDLLFSNFDAAGSFQNVPLYLLNNGTALFLQRPYYGEVSAAARFITYAEAVALVGGGGGGGGTVTSVFGRTGPLIDAADGDYNSSQITHGAGSVASALASKSDNFDTLDGGAI